MVNYTLDQLAQDVEKADGRNRLFTWYRAGGMLPFANDTQARVAFETRLNNPAQRDAIFNAYLPVYSQERNQRSMKSGLTKAGIAAGTGLIAIVLALFVDSKSARFVLEAVGTGSSAAGLIGAGVTYLRYKT